jgi:hypothetical protein
MSDSAPPPTIPEAVASTSTDPVNPTEAAMANLLAKVGTNPLAFVLDEKRFQSLTKKEMSLLMAYLQEQGYFSGTARPLASTTSTTRPRDPPAGDRDLATRLAMEESRRRPPPRSTITNPFLESLMEEEDVDYHREDDWTADPHADLTPSPFHLSIKDFKLPTPTSYAGASDLQKIQNWISEMETMNILCRLSSKNGEAVFNAAMYLTGDAKTWWRLLLKDTPRNEWPIRWGEFADLITKRFAPQHAELHIRDKLHQLSQTASVQAYISEFRRLILLHPPMSAEDRKDRFIRGLKPHIRTSVRIQEPRDIEHAERIALHLDAFWGKGQQLGNPGHQPQQDVRRTGQQTGNNPNPPRHGNQGGNGANPTQGGQPRHYGNESRGAPAAVQPQGNVTPRKLTPQERDYLRQNNGCFRCRQLGHLANVCPTYPSTPQTPVNPQNTPRLSRQPARLNNAEVQTQTPVANPVFLPRH